MEFPVENQNQGGGIKKFPISIPQKKQFLKIQTIISYNIDTNIRISYNKSHDELVLHRGNFIW